MSNFLPGFISFSLASFGLAAKRENAKARSPLLGELRALKCVLGIQVLKGLEQELQGTDEAETAIFVAKPHVHVLHGHS